MPQETEEDRLRAQIERLVGGRVAWLERQPRWRKAWFAEVERNGQTVPIYVRGDKQLDAEPYPGLGREATLLRLFAAQGLPAPHVYGMSEDPEAIIMDRTPGTRDMAQARNDEERRDIARQYIDVLVKMHSLDIAPFVAAGIHCPKGPEAVALSYVDANISLYRRTKRGAQPLIEWALKWVQRNAPRDRERPSILHADPGQFLFHQGKLTCIYDFEASHIGDPIADLAALRSRHGFEPLGAEPDELIRYYQSRTGEKIDPKLLSFHTASFMLMSTMALAGPLHEPGPKEMQLEYLIWDVMTRRATLWGIGEYLDQTIKILPPVAIPQGRSGLVAKVLSATIDRIDTASGLGRMDRASALALADWALAQQTARTTHEAADLDRAAAILGHRPADWRSADIALEQFVLDAGPEHDLALFHYFAAQVEQQVAEAVSVQDRLAPYAFPRVLL